LSRSRASTATAFSSSLVSGTARDPVVLDVQAFRWWLSGGVGEEAGNTGQDRDEVLRVGPGNGGVLGEQRWPGRERRRAGR
jgi:hypothetical protein